MFNMDNCYLTHNFSLFTLFSYNYRTAKVTSVTIIFFVNNIYIQFQSMCKVPLFYLLCYSSSDYIY